MPEKFSWDEYVDLRPMNTFGLPSIARHFVRIGTEDLISLVTSSRFRRCKRLILGSGSNIVLATPMYDGIILRNDISSIEIASQQDSSTLLKVGGGLLWDSLVTFCIQHDLGGLENLSMIPGTVGAAPVQNIGAYGVEVSQIIDSVVVCDLNSGVIDTMCNKDCEFGYRTSVFKSSRNDTMILSVIIRVSNPGHHQYNTSYESLKKMLKAQDMVEPSLQAIRSAVCTIRQERLPDLRVLGNAGSFFQNVMADESVCNRLLAINPSIPVFKNRYGTKTIPSSWLIEHSGSKAKTRGQASCYENNALVIVNHGNATATDILDLSQDIITSVQQHFHVTLTREVQIIY